MKITFLKCSNCDREQKVESQTQSYICIFCGSELQPKKTKRATLENYHKILDQDPNASSVPEEFAKLMIEDEIDELDEYWDNEKIKFGKAAFSDKNPNDISYNNLRKYKKFLLIIFLSFIFSGIFMLTILFKIFSKQFEIFPFFGILIFMIILSFSFSSFVNKIKYSKAKRQYLLKKKELLSEINNQL